MANNDFFLTGPQEPLIPAPKQFEANEFVPGPTNVPRPVDITPQVTDIFRPQTETLTPTQEWLRGKETPAMQASRAQQQNQGAISDFMQTPTQIPPPVAGQTAPIPSAQPQMPTAPQLSSEGSELRSIQNDTTAVADRMGLKGEERNKFLREQTQAENVKRAKEGISARASSKIAIKALQEQGMNPEEIKAKLGVTGTTTPQELLTGLRRLQGERTGAMSGKGINAKLRDSIVQKSQFNEANEPTNTEGRAKQFLDFTDDFGPDPQSETSNYESMKPSERNQVDRTLKSMARGSKDPNAERKLKDLISKVEIRRDREYMKKQADREEESLTLASKKAQTAEDNATRESYKAQISAWKDELDVLTDERKKARGDRRGQIDDRKKEISLAITSFNEGFESGAQVGAEVAGQPTTNQQAHDIAKQAGQSNYVFEGENYVVQ